MEGHKKANRPRKGGGFAPGTGRRPGSRAEALGEAHALKRRRSAAPLHPKSAGLCLSTLLP
jgi:hypothetical protein